MKKKKIALISVILLISVVYSSHKIYEFNRNRLLSEKRKADFKALEEELNKEAANFAGETSVVVKDLDNGLEITIDQDKKLPSASLAKVPIMAAYFYAAHEKKINLAETLRLKATDIVSGSGVLKNEPTGRELTIEELIELMIVESDNTATNILIGRLGFDYLNAVFKSLGLEDTNVNRNMMDFKSRKKGIENFTSARDLKLLLNKIYKEDLINRDYSFKCLEFLKRQTSRNRIPAQLPADIVVAHKTGLERSVCHDAGIVFTRHGDFLICVLTKHNGRNSARAKEFISQIALLAYNCYQNF